ncbi:hypothetical protein D3C78_1705050 [compost metagenome]
MKPMERSTSSASMPRRLSRSYTFTLVDGCPARPSMMWGKSATLGSKPIDDVNWLSSVVRGMPYQ